MTFSLKMILKLDIGIYDWRSAFVNLHDFFMYHRFGISSADFYIAQRDIGLVVSQHVSISLMAFFSSR